MSLKRQPQPALLAVALSWMLMGVAADAPAQARPAWMNRSLTAAQRADAVLAAMTEDEKLTLVFGYFGGDMPPHYKKIAQALPQSAGYVHGVPRLGIPAQFQTDAGLGVASQQGPAPRERTSLPGSIAAAAAWDTALAERGGRMIGAEARASGFNVMLAGGVNLQREPRNGRNFEYAGEDPLLAGRTMGAAVRGIQHNHIVSTVKHYALNAQETGRFVLNARIDEAAFRASDLLAMQFAIEDGKPGSIMGAYNKVNGQYACENPFLLNTVLKGEWGFAGYVMSDWGATHSTAAAANAGLDQESGADAFDKAPYFGAPLKAALKSGEVPRARLDDMARRVLWALFDKGVVDHPVAPGGAIDFQSHGRVTREAAEAGMVLLKNEAQLLPLTRGPNRELKRLLLVGGHADVGVLSGGGSSKVYPVGGLAVKGLQPENWPGPVIYFPSSPMRELQALLPGTQVEFDNGLDPASAAKRAAQADAVVVFATHWVGEAVDGASLSLPDGQDALIQALAAANPRTAVVLETGNPVLMPWLGNVPAVLQAWYPGTRGGEAIARVLTGAVNPAGRLPVTFPMSESQLPRLRVDGDPKDESVGFDVDYHEGAAVGYKWFDLKGLKPLFPFGHGLSYTRFARSELKPQWKDGRLSVRFSVSNIGSREGQDISQVYVAPAVVANANTNANTVKWEAPKRLGGWAKLALKPGEKRSVVVDIEPRLLATPDGKGGWQIAAGAYELLLAENAADSQAQRAVVELPALALDAQGRVRAKPEAKTQVK